LLFNSDSLEELDEQDIKEIDNIKTRIRGREMLVLMFLGFMKKKNLDIFYNNTRFYHNKSINILWRVL
tara:strand:+ start:477 stop:680 length:204 start_codon:yes stop_codon:yes gene_type:complete